MSDAAQKAQNTQNALLHKIIASVQALAADVQYIKAEVASIKSAVRESNFESSTLIHDKLNATHERLVDDMLLVGEVMRSDLRNVHARIEIIEQRIPSLLSEVASNAASGDLGSSELSMHSGSSGESVEERSLNAERRQEHVPLPMTPPSLQKAAPLSVPRGVSDQREESTHAITPNWSLIGERRLFATTHKDVNESGSLRESHLRATVGRHQSRWSHLEVQNGGHSRDGAGKGGNGGGGGDTGFHRVGSSVNSASKTEIGRDDGGERLEQDWAAVAALQLRAELRPEPRLAQSGKAGESNRQRGEHRAFGQGLRDRM
eukprot:INCI14415.1.p1 GENE.INCI14415.1~~INCI14415.1.p1  ORF type:complete len:318 (-),score=41.44 INCI14415.1:18-971(-)